MRRSADGFCLALEDGKDGPVYAPGGRDLLEQLSVVGRECGRGDVRTLCGLLLAGRYAEEGPAVTWHVEAIGDPLEDVQSRDAPGSPDDLAYPALADLHRGAYADLAESDRVVKHVEQHAHVTPG
jgi:hypothetical protein